MSILLYKKWSKKVENLARGLIWVLLEYPKTPPPRAPPKVRYRAPKGRPRRWRQGAWVLFHKISNDMSILRFSIYWGFQKWSTFASFAPSDPSPPPRVPMSLRARAPKGCPWGGGGEGGWILFQKISNDISILGFAIMISICFKGTLRTPTPQGWGIGSPTPKHDPRGGGKLSTISQNQRYVWVFNIVRN